MAISQALHRWLPVISAQSAAEIDADIREELEFHLAMKAEDNQRAGMPPDQARRDAEERFGNFESQRRACRKITLGPRLLLQRLQHGLIALLIGAVVYQAVLLARLQTSSNGQIEALRLRVLQLQSAPSAPAAVIPTLQWDRNTPIDNGVADMTNDTHLLIGWETTTDPLSRPWCDWRSLDDEHQQL